MEVSLYVKELSDDAIEIVIEAMKNKTSPYSLLNVPYFGPTVRNVPVDATAFRTRSAAFMVSLDGNWTDKSDNGQRHFAWVRETWDKLQPYSDGSVYLNF